jgi:hypothetical protein
LTTVGLFVREMGSNSRRIDFVGLTNTLLTESNVLYLAGVLESLRPEPRLRAHLPRPKLEIQNTSLSAPVRERLMRAGNNAGIDVLLSASHF